MTKEELEKEAEEYGIDNFEQCMYDDVKGWETDCKARVQAYIDGAEPREKRIAELEESLRKLQKGTFNMIDEKNNRIAELEKENAELKLEALEGQIPWKDIKDKSEVIGQLTKAKELLKEFVHHYKDKTIYIENMQDLLEQVERFIKDSEVEK